MKKKGFTLVELLAVIAILAILVILALPNVMGMYQNAQKNAFVTELESILKAGNTQFVSDNMAAKGAATGIAYTRTGGSFVSSGTVDSFKRTGENGASYKTLDLQGSTDIDFYLEYNLAGKAIAFYASDKRFQFAYEGPGLETGKIYQTKIEKNAITACVAGDSSIGTTALKFNLASRAPVNTGVISIADAVEYCPKETVTVITFNASLTDINMSAENKGNENVSVPRS